MFKECNLFTNTSVNLGENNSSIMLLKWKEFFESNTFFTYRNEIY